MRVTSVHLPGLNTTQFGWSRRRCGAIRGPSRRSVSPSSPPTRSCGRANTRAGSTSSPARPSRRSSATGSPRTSPTATSPRTAVDGQQTDIPIEPVRPDYLDEPLPGDRGSRATGARRALPAGGRSALAAQGRRGRRRPHGHRARPGPPPDRSGDAHRAGRPDGDLRDRAQRPAGAARGVPAARTRHAEFVPEEGQARGVQIDIDGRILGIAIRSRSGSSATPCRRCARSRRC